MKPGIYSASSDQQEQLRTGLKLNFTFDANQFGNLLKHVGTLKYRVCGHQSQIKRANKAAQTGRVVTQRLNKLLWDSKLICPSPVSAA